jgi:EmrB/QacA subfamily drug resistance transporter
MPVTTAPVQETAHLDWWPLAVIGSAHLMAVLDTTIMFVALPSIQHGLDMSVASRQWVVTSYTLALAGLLLLGGRLADRLGARRTLVIGVVGFAAASAVGGTSIDGAMLIAARAVQGAFGAVLVSSTKALLVTVYKEEHERAKVLGVFTATLTAGLAVGLVLGGIITSGLGWRWCLYLNIIFSVFVVIGALRVLPQLPHRPEIRIDLWSVLSASMGMAGLVYGLGEAASAGWGSGRVVGSLVAAVVLLAAFVLRQFGHADRLLPLRVVAERNRGMGVVALAVNALSTFGMMLILTYQLQSIMDYPALKTGLALFPFALGAVAGSAFLGPRLMRQVPPRFLITAAVVVEAAGLVPLIWLRPHIGYLPLILLATVVEGIGTGLAGPTTLNTALRGVLPSDAGAAGAATSAVGQLGSSVGAALFNTIAATVTVGYLAAHPNVSMVAATVHGFNVAMTWGVLILLAAAIPIALFVNAPAVKPKLAAPDALYPRPPGRARSHPPLRQI